MIFLRWMVYGKSLKSCELMRWRVLIGGEYELHFNWNSLTELLNIL